MDVATRNEPRPTETGTGDARERAAGAGRRLVAAARYALPALVAYAVVRAVGVLTVVIWAGNVEKDAVGLLTKSDGDWYLRIARNGYDGFEKVQSDMAFFPLYPGLIRALEPLTPLSWQNTALMIAWIASLAAAWGLFAIGDHVYGRGAGVALAALWAALPHGVVQSMAYSEGIFTALAAWSLYAVLRSRWLTAGTLCVFAGLTRPTASALIAVVGLAALIAAVRRRDGWRPWAAMVLAPAGWLGYLAWVARETGRPDGWFHIQGAGWGTTFDFGVYTWEKGRQVLAGASPLQMYMVTLVAVLAIVLFVLSLIDRQPWPLLVYSGLLLVTSLGAAGYYHSKARFLLPAFPLLLPAALALVRAGRARAVTVLVGLTVLSAYYGAYLLLIWGRSP